MSRRRLLAFIVCIFVPLVAWADDWQVQVGAYRHPHPAELRQAEVQAILHREVFVFSRDLHDKVLYVVRIIHLRSEQEANAILTTLKQHGISAWKSHQQKHENLQWLKNPQAEKQRLRQSRRELYRAYEQPEVVLREPVHMPVAPDKQTQRTIDMSLRDAILLLLRYNPSVQNQELDRITARYGLRVAQNEFELQYALRGNLNFSRSKTSGIRLASTETANLTPEVSLKTALGTQFNLSLSNDFDLPSRHNPVANFSVSQPLLRGFGPEVVQRSLNDTYDNEVIAQLSFKQNLIGAIVQVINDYRTLISANNRILTARTSLKDAIKTFEANKAKIEAGQLEPSSNVQQEAQIEQLRLSLENTINNAGTTQQTLLLSMGLDPTMNIRVPDDVDISNVKPLNKKEAVTYALKHNIQYQNALIQFRKAQRSLRVSEESLRWQLDLNASASVGSGGGIGGDSGFDSLVNGRNQNQSIGLSLQVPINDIPSRANVINAKVALEKARVNLAATRRALIQNVTNEVRNITSFRQQVEIAKKSLVLAQRSYDLEKQKRLAGISASIDVTTTQDRLIAAKIALVDTKIAYLNSITLLRATLATTFDDWGLELRY